MHSGLAQLGFAVTVWDQIGVHMRCPQPATLVSKSLFFALLLIGLAPSPTYAGTFVAFGPANRAKAFRDIWDEMGGPESRKKTKAGKESICSPLGLGEQAPGDQARKKIISVVVSKVTLWIG